MKKTSPTGQHVVVVDGKEYTFKLTHWSVSKAEELLGTSLLAFKGGQITYNISVAFAMLYGQHGINSRGDIADLFDRGPSEEIDDAIAWAIVDFFRQYPTLLTGLEPVIQALELKAARTAP